MPLWSVVFMQICWAIRTLSLQSISMTASKNQTSSLTAHQTLQWKNTTMTAGWLCSPSCPCSSSLCSTLSCIRGESWNVLGKKQNFKPWLTKWWWWWCSLQGERAYPGGLQHDHHLTPFFPHCWAGQGRDAGGHLLFSHHGNSLVHQQ